MNYKVALFIVYSCLILVIGYRYSVNEIRSVRTNYGLSSKLRTQAIQSVITVF